MIDRPTNEWHLLSAQDRATHLRADASVSLEKGHHLDAEAYASAAQAYEDQIVGITRCTCGRILRRRKIAQEPAS